MTTKFNIGDTVIDNEGIKGRVISIIIDEYGIKYNVKRCNGTLIESEREDKLIKAPVTREEALTAALKDVGKNVSKGIDVELSEIEGHFELWTRTHNGPYIGKSKEEYHYEVE